MPEPSEILIFDLAKPEHYNQWLEIWNEWPNREVYAHPDYVRLFSLGVGTPKAALMRRNQGTVLYPFITRQIPTLGRSSGSMDIISPYGYGGMFAWGDEENRGMENHFYQLFDVWCKQNQIVSEFVRFSLFSDNLLQYPYPSTHRSDNVVVPLNAEEEQIWMSYEAKVRKNVKKAVRNDVRVEFDETGVTLESFYRIFESTMDRRQAENSYYFSLDFFRDLFESIRGSYVIANAIHNDTIVSTELVLVSANAIYSFLGGTDSSSFDVRPNDLLKHEVILWAKSQGKQNYVLGGGYQKDDGIFRYKKSFAPHNILPFYTGERKVDPVEYTRLVDVMLSSLSSADATELRSSLYFPLYRAI